VGVGNDDEVCSNCGAVFETKDNTDGIVAAGDFKKESNFVDIAKGIRDSEGSDDELSAKEMVADEIIGDGIVAGGDFKKESSFVEIAKEIRDSGVPDDELAAKEMVADEIIGNGIVAADLSSSNEKPKTPSPVQPQVKPKAPVKIDGTDKVLSLGDWMITLLLLFIPIVNIVMLIIWSVDSSTNENKKHFAWAYLIYMAIGVVVSIIFSSILISAIIATMGSMAY